MTDPKNRSTEELLKDLVTTVSSLKNEVNALKWQQSTVSEKAPL